MSSQNIPGLSTGTTDSDQTVTLAFAVFVAVIAGIFVVVALSGAGITGSDASADGTVAVVSIEGPIVQPIGEQLEDELSGIRANDSIDAVVLEMNTPGGSPAPTERMYLSIQRTSEQMPLHASVQSVSASAGYYMMLPAEKIYVLPTSVVGSVGAATREPRPTPPVEGPSGPDKRGSNVIQEWASDTTLANIFIETVIEQRGDRIELDRDGISTAKVFYGVESVENGFADEIGSLDDAVADAADKAGLDDYRTVERDVSAGQRLPILARTEHGMVAIYDENPSIADIEPLDSTMVYEPAVPHIDELEAVSESDIPDRVGETGESGGEQS